MGAIPQVTNHYRGCRKVPTMSQVLSSIQCICLRRTSGSNRHHLMSLHPCFWLRNPWS